MCAWSTVQFNCSQKLLKETILYIEEWNKRLNSYYKKILTNAPYSKKILTNAPYSTNIKALGEIGGYNSEAPYLRTYTPPRGDGILHHRGENESLHHRGELNYYTIEGSLDITPSTGV